MIKSSIICSFCGKNFLRDRRHINESQKLGAKAYCSPVCLSKDRMRQASVICSNPKCLNKFNKSVSDITKNNYCSRSCAVSVNNAKNPKRPLLIKKCANCGKEFIRREKYCSPYCGRSVHLISKEYILKSIREFHEKNGRAPMKREFSSQKAVRRFFGSWNNAILEAGFNPQPVMFANKWFAIDGHKCDSLSEKIIDDWLFRRKVKHLRSVPYPENHNLNADFVINNYWIEFFGLAGEHKRYDELRQLKLLLSKKHKLNLIEIFPEDIYRNRLGILLKTCINKFI